MTEEQEYVLGVLLILGFWILVGACAVDGVVWIHLFVKAALLVIMS